MACHMCPGGGGGGGGGGGPAADCSYLVLSACGALTHERRFVAGTGLTAVDTGPGGTYTLSVTGYADLVSTCAGAVAGEIAVYSAANTICFDTDFTWDSTNKTLKIGHAAGVGSTSTIQFSNSTGNSLVAQQRIAGLSQLSISGQDEIAFRIGGTLEGKVDNSGNWLLGTGALATNANLPFPTIPMMAGPPTGNPASVIAGMAPIVIDQTDTRFYWYQNQGVTGWYFVSAGANVSSCGTEVAGEVTFFTAAKIICGNSNFTWDNTTGLAVTRAVNITANAASSFTTSAGALTITAAAASTWSTAAGALTLTSAAAATWSTAAGNLSIDAAALLNLGATNATGVQISRSGINVAIGGAGSFGSGTGEVFLADTTLAPSTNPVGGGIMYSNSGQLTWRDTAGNVTQLT